MMRKLSITFREVDAPISDAVTKFGGQPVWIAAPQWPLSRATGEPMQFIGQIALDPGLFPNTSARMAYLFMTDQAAHPHVDGTWEAYGGENAVVLQPGEYRSPVLPLEEGPALEKMVDDPQGGLRRPEPCEYAVELEPGEDPDLQELEREAAWDVVAGNKIGGTPGFLQAEEYPDDGDWRLLLQLDSANVPFWINFGDAGIGYAFLSADGTRAAFLWQCG